MARIEKTVFISYRRKDISWALAVYQYLTSQKFDVFFDYTSIPSGDFEQIIVSNIKARAHFVLILTPTSLDRCKEPGDWLRREIETAVDEKRNIIPLFFDGFSFGLPTIPEKLTGKLSAINRYNGLDIPSGYFMEAMERLRIRYLNIPLNAVIHPVSTEVLKLVKDEQVAADKALEQKREDIDELVKPAQETHFKPEQTQNKKTTITSPPFRRGGWGVSQFTNLRPYGIGIGILLFAVFGIAGINSLIKNLAGKAIQTPTLSSEGVVSSTSTFPPSPPTDTATNPPFTPTSGFVIGSTMTGKDSMTLLYVPAGEFTMGSEIGDDDEKPVHAVYLDAFWIDQTEVTNGMYAMCVEAGECTKHFIESSFSRPNYYGNPEFDDFPVIYVSWDYASAYCSWADRRLPTEAEWEKAARGENAFIYPWGENEPNNTFLNYVSSDTPGEDNDTTKVGKYPKGASPYGALDMAGNVWEWVSDWYDPNYYNSSPSSNPQGPESGQQRITRGGSWQENISFTIRSAYRVETDPLGMDNALGFRCAMSASK